MASRTEWLRLAGAEGYIADKLEAVEAEISDLIFDSEGKAHSPYETTFLMGRLAELNYQKMKFELDLRALTEE